MKNSICINGSKCGCFNFCTMDDFGNCSGKIRPNTYSKNLFLNLLPEFKDGKCAHCSLETKVAEVNSDHNKACLKCWLIIILPRRTINSLVKERGINFQYLQKMSPKI